jgi:hypothetical protein
MTSDLGRWPELAGRVRWNRPGEAASRLNVARDPPAYGAEPIAAFLALTSNVPRPVVKS